MSQLELKIPPLLLMAIFGGLMWLLARWLPTPTLPYWLQFGSCLVLLICGAAFSAAGVWSFREVHTTVDPLHPAATSSLVTGGIYRFSRNPMYVGFLCFLTAWGLWLSSAYALLVCVAYVLYMNRFQIEPEERALLARFGDDFVSYRRQVRRWL